MKVRQIVNVPADRGDKPYVGTITHVGDIVSKNVYGSPYVWVGVRKPNGVSSSWPSNRLGFSIPGEKA